MQVSEGVSSVFGTNEGMKRSQALVAVTDFIVCERYFYMRDVLQTFVELILFWIFIENNCLHSMYEIGS